MYIYMMVKWFNAEGFMRFSYIYIFVIIMTHGTRRAAHKKGVSVDFTIYTSNLTKNSNIHSPCERSSIYTHIYIFNSIENIY